MTLMYPHTINTINTLALIGRSKPLIVDLPLYEERLRQEIKRSSFLVIGGAGSIGQAVVKEIFARGPAGSMSWIFRRTTSLSWCGTSAAHLAISRVNSGPSPSTSVRSNLTCTLAMRGLSITSSISLRPQTCPQRKRPLHAHADGGCQYPEHHQDDRDVHRLRNEEIFLRLHR